MNEAITASRAALVLAVLVGNGTPAATITDPVSVTVLHTFAATDGTTPKGELTLGTDGDFYGTAEQGGAHGSGAVYRITPAGAVTVLHSFNGADGSHPRTGVTLASDGNFYGVAANAGPHLQGVIFKLTPSGQFSVLHAFNYDDPRAGSFAGGRLTSGIDGSLYGVTVIAGNPSQGALYRLTMDGSFTLIPVHEGKNRVCCGETVVVGQDGNFYGVSRDGGAAGMGSVFKLTPDGVVTSLHVFDGADGAQPRAALVQAHDGTLYGSAARSAPDSQCPNCGVLFKITPGGDFTVLHRFTGNDGREPMSALSPSPDGTFIGATTATGAHSQGALFRLTSQGAVTPLALLDTADSDRDEVYLLLGSDGNYYGTASEGGPSRLGTFFKMVPRASTRTVLIGGPGTQAILNGRVLSYRETASGRVVSVNVQRPAYVNAQMQPSVGVRGPWIWLSPDGKDGAMISVAQDGSVQVSPIDGASARRFLPPGATP